MKNILFLNNYKDHSRQVYEFALQIGQHFGGLVHSTYVFKYSLPALFEDDAEVIRNYYDGLAERIDEQVEKESERLKNFVTSHTHKQNHPILGDLFIREGDKVYEILDIIQEEDMDLVVMGMNQQPSLSNLFFGNLSMQIIDKVPCPVLLVPPKTRANGINHIVYAANFVVDDLNSIEYMLEWAKIFDAHLYVVHVATSSIDYDLSEDVLDKLRNDFADLITEKRISFHLVDRNEESAIRKFTKVVHADLIGLTTHIRGFWAHFLEPSVTKDIAQTIDIPILVLKTAQ